MDRFIVFAAYLLFALILDLKSNMDRFIDILGLTDSKQTNI